MFLLFELVHTVLTLSHSLREDVRHRLIRTAQINCLLAFLIYTGAKIFKTVFRTFTLHVWDLVILALDTFN